MNRPLVGGEILSDCSTDCWDRGRAASSTDVFLSVGVLDPPAMSAAGGTSFSGEVDRIFPDEVEQLRAGAL